MVSSFAVGLEGRAGAGVLVRVRRLGGEGRGVGEDLRVEGLEDELMD